MLTNPFIYGDPVSPDNFIGRRRILRRVLGRLQNGQSTAIIGDPHIGKTSLLNYLTTPGMRQELSGEQAQRRYFSLLDAQMFSSQFSPAQFWEQALVPVKEHIVETTRPSPSLRQALRQAQDTTQDIAQEGNWSPSADSLPSATGAFEKPILVSLPGGELQNIARHYAICKDNAFGNFTLERLFAQFKQADCRFLLLLDECDALLHHPVLNSVEFYGGLRSLASRCPAFTLVIASRTPISQLNKLTQEFNPTGSPFFNIFSEATLGPLAEKDADALFARAEGRFGPKEKSFLTALAGRHPFLLQAASAMLWETFEEEDLFHPEKIRTHVATRLYREFDHFFADTWNVWTPEMRKAFTAVAMAHQAALLPGTKFRLSALLKDVPHWGPELGDLEERGLIVKDNKLETGYRVSAGILLIWLADELVKVVRSDQPFERWLQEQRIEGAFLSHKEEKAFKEAVTATAKALGKGATAVIEAFGKGLGSGIAGKVV